MRRSFRLAVALSIAVLSSALLLAAGAPSQAHMAVACGAPQRTSTDWC